MFLVILTAPSAPIALMGFIALIFLCLGIWVGRATAPRFLKEDSLEFKRLVEEERAKVDEQVVAVRLKGEEEIAREEAHTTKVIKNLKEKVAETYKRLDEARSSCEKAEADSVAFLKMVEERKQQRLQSIIQEYENSLAELFSDLAAKEQNYRVAIQELQGILADLSSKERIAYENLQKTLERNFPNRLHLSERSISEMKELYGICNRLSNALPLYKAIYDLYLKVELADLVRRTGAAGKCGIYRITNVTNGMVYIGQSVNIGERWKQHVKRGTGCEVGTIAGGKLYNAMLKEGIWNFDFEILQECDRSLLSANEKFWIDHFNSKENGYNSKDGASLPL